MEVLKFVFVLCVALDLVVVLLATDARHISHENPCDSYNDVIHIAANGSRDTIHYVYSSNGLPSVLVARTGTDSKLQLDCWRFHSNNASSVAESVQFSHPPDAVMVLLFNRLFQYVDKDDTADMDDYRQSNSSWFDSYDLSAASWQDLTFDNVSHTVTYTTNNDSHSILPLLANGSLSFKFHVFADRGYGSELPHLGYNENTTHVDVVLDRLRSNDSQSRFAVELVLVAGGTLAGEMSMSQQDTLDDEHSPGSFHSVDWLVKTPGGSSGAFFSWKPTCYTTRSRKVGSSVRVRDYGLHHVDSEESVNSSGLALAFFGSLDNRTHVRASNVSFGGPKDKQYYNVTQYSAWTFAVGLGAPLTDSFSLLLIVVFAVCVGILLLVIVASFVYIVLRRLCGRHRGYAEISSSYAEIN